MDKIPSDGLPKPEEKPVITQYKRQYSGEREKKGTAPASSLADTDGQVNLPNASPRIRLLQGAGPSVLNKPNKGDSTNNWFVFYHRRRLKWFNYFLKDLVKTPI